jgi:hypothetical protein
MAALGWQLNLDFAASGTPDVADESRPDLLLLIKVSSLLWQLYCIESAAGKSSK